MDGFATAGTDLGSEISYSSTETNGLAQATIDLTGISDLQNRISSTTITFRLYAWGASATGGTFAIGRLSGNDLAIGGSVVADISAPTVTTGTPGSLTSSGATITGSEVTSDGGGTISQRGVVYATSSNPTTSNGKVIVSGEMGTFNADITGLASSTLYYVRAYATNAAGTSYGSNETFTTSAASGLIETDVETLTAFTSTYGTASSTQTLTISGSGLSGDLTVTATTGFEVSLEPTDNFGTSKILTETGGVLGETPVYVRVRSTTAPGNPSGNVTISGGDAETVNVSISASTVSAKALTIEGAAVTTKTFNGTTAAVITGSLTGVIDGDAVGFSGTGTFDTADAGENKSVTSTSSLTGADASKYSLTQPTGLTGTIDKANQTINFAALPSKYVDDEDFTVNPTATPSGLTVSLNSSNTAVATVSGNTITIIGAGTTTITASQSGNTNYNAATPIERELNVSSAELVAGWDFQTTTTGGSAAAASPSSPKVFNANFGSGTIYLDGTNGSSNWVAIASGNELTSFAGTASVNLTTGFSTVTTAPASLAIVNSSANGKNIVFKLNLRVYQDVIVSYAAQRTSAGFDSHVWSYSTNGTDWTTAETIPISATSFAVTSVATITGLNQSINAYLRLTVSGASNATGNNRIDNIQIRATEIPNTSLTGTAGWRLLSSPVSGSTYADVLGPIWTQGATGSDAPENGSSNVFWSEGSTTASLVQTSVTNLNTALTPGRGFAVYVYNDDNYDADGGTTWPKTLSVTGSENAADATYTPTWTAGTQYAIAGNPFASTIDWDGLVATKGANVHDAVWVWNPATSTYDDYNGANGNLTGGLIAPFQGFWIQYNGAASGLTFPASAKSTGGSFRGKEEAPRRMVVRASDSVGSNLAWVAFRDGATLGEDRYDAVKFTPLSSDYIQAFTIAADKAHGINVLPSDLTDDLEIPLGVSSTRGGSITLDLTELNLPNGWMASLRDNVTGQSLAVNAEFSYTFESVRAKAAPVSETPHVLAANDPRFTLIIDPASSTSVDRGPETVGRMELEQNYPNPFNPSTQIRFTLQSSDVTRLTVYDVLGREVAVLVDGVMAQGSHSVTFDASNITSGVYLYKLEAGGMTQVRRMTLVK